MTDLDCTDEWNGFWAFRIWIAVNSHITGTYEIKKYGIRNPKLGGSFEKFNQRPDRNLFNRVPFMMSAKTWIRVCAASAMYGVKYSNPYDFSKVEVNYKLYLSRWHGFNQMLRDDFKTLNRLGVKADDYIGIVKALLKNHIAFETVVALNCIVPIVRSIMNSREYGDGRSPLASILKPLLTRLDKSKIFIRMRVVESDAFRNFAICSDGTFNEDVLKSN